MGRDEIDSGQSRGDAEKMTTKKEILERELESYNKGYDAGVHDAKHDTALAIFKDLEEAYPLFSDKGTKYQRIKEKWTK